METCSRFVAVGRVDTARGVDGALRMVSAYLHAKPCMTDHKKLPTIDSIRAPV